MKKKSNSNNSNNGNYAKNPILYLRIGKSGQFETNYPQWYEWWSSTKIGTYGEIFKQQFDEGMSLPINFEGEMAELALQAEQDASKDMFIATPEQRALIAAAPMARRQLMEREFYVEWATQIRENNVAIAASNIVKKKRIELLVAKVEEQRETAAKIIADVMSTMDRNSMTLVESYRRELADGENYDDITNNATHYSIGLARRVHDWYFVFSAAKATHVARLSAIADPVALQQRQDQEQDKLKNLYHSGGYFTNWNAKWQHQLEACQSVELNITDQSKRIFYMACINKELFVSLLNNWRDPIQRVNLPDNFEDLRALVQQEFSRVSNENPGLVNRVQSKQTKYESSLKVEEEKASKPVARGKCEICEANHATDKCNFRNKKYAVPANRWYYLKQLKKKESDSSKSDVSVSSTQSPAESKWEPTKGTIAQPPKGQEKKESINHVEEEKEEIDILHSVFSVTEESVYKSRVVPNVIDLIYDTGTEISTITPAASSILLGVHNDPAVLVGIGGSTRTTEAGYTIFGKTRVLKMNGQKCLVSHTEAESRWQLSNPREGVLTLKEWPGKRVTGRTWTFIKDPERHGDKLYHLILSHDDFPEFMASAGVPREEVNSLYQPRKPIDLSKLSGSEQARVNAVQDLHSMLNHTSAQGLLRIVDAENDQDLPTEQRVGVSREDVVLWQKNMSEFCIGCLQGRMKEHSRVASTKMEKPEVGTVATGDLMFIDQRNGNKTPMFLCVDVGSKVMMGIHLTGKEESEIERSIDVVCGEYKSNGHQLKELSFDRESALVSISDSILAKGINPRIKAAGQKAGLAEVSISLIRGHARSTKAGVRNDFMYNPLVQWNNDLVLDTIGVLNRQIKTGFSKSPVELFTGKKIDYIRDFRVRWGEVVLAKKPKGIASDLEVTSRWAVVVRRFMNRTGVIKFFIIDTKRYAYGLKFARAKVPKRIIDELNNLDVKSNKISSESGEPDETDLNEAEDNHDNLIEDGVLDNFDPHEPESEQQREQAREVYRNLYQDRDPIYDENDPGVYLPEEEPVNREIAELQSAWLPRPAREKRESRPPVRLVYSVNPLIYEQAAKSRPDEALKALDKELDVMLAKNVWSGVLERDLSPEQRKLILPNMKNYLEKYLPSGEFEKSKVRVLVRGDKQFEVGETEGPVCRVETIFFLFAVAAYHDLEVFGIDFVAAYLNTPNPEAVKHRWLLLDPVISRRLIERDPTTWRPFFRSDKKILVHMNKLGYGYKEAAHYWNAILMEMFIKGGWSVSKKDKCLVYRATLSIPALVALTVDDLTGVAPRGSGVKEQLMALCRATFDEITIKEGDVINVIGMTFEMDRLRGAVSISQKRFVDKTVETFGVTKKAITPSTEDLFDDDPNDKLLDDQLSFMSINSTCMYGGKRTYPEVLPATTYLATKYWKATERDYKKALRVVEYFNYHENHCLYLRPKSLDIVVSADASYAEHPDAKSHSGGCVGFEGYNGEGCFFMFISSKQPVVAKSSCEAELICANTVADHMVWLSDLKEEVGFPSVKPVRFDQDNQSAMQIAMQGKGTFKRTKHIKVRFFWIKDLIDSGLMVFKYVMSSEMVADILSKPTVGSKFQYLLAKLLGWNTKEERMD